MSSTNNCSSVTLAKVNDLHIGHYVMIKKKPCQITRVRYSSTGKVLRCQQCNYKVLTFDQHGRRKAHMTGACLFTNKKYEEIFFTSDSVDTPIVTKQAYQIMDIYDSTVTCLHPESCEVETFSFPACGSLEEYTNLARAFADAQCKGKVTLVTVLRAVGQQRVLPQASSE